MARALDRDGYRVILGRCDYESGCERSGSISEIWDHAPMRAGDDTVFRQLDRLLAERPDISAVFPVGKAFVDGIARRCWVPEGDAVLVGPGHSAVRLFADKVSGLSVAQRRAVRSLPFEMVRAHEQLARSADRIGYPVVVRCSAVAPVFEHRKVVFAATPEELLGAIPEWPEGQDHLIVQRRANGQRHNVYFAAEQGRVLALSEAQVRRSADPEGWSAAVCGTTTVLSPALVRDTQTLAAAESYSGIGVARFIVDEVTGDRCFIGLRPGVADSHGVAEAAGVPLAVMAMDLALGRAVETPEPYLEGVPDLHFSWAVADVAGAERAYARGEIGRFALFGRWLEALANGLWSDVDLVWTWHDPAPARHMLRELLAGTRQNLADPALIGTRSAGPLQQA